MRARRQAEENGQYQGQNEERRLAKSSQDVFHSSNGRGATSERACYIAHRQSAQLPEALLRNGNCQVRGAQKRTPPNDNYQSLP